MQPRTLLETLEEIEKALPKFKTFIDSQTELKNKIIIADDFDSFDAKDCGDISPLPQLIEQLKSKLASTPKTEITEDITTRADQAIRLNELYIKQAAEINLEIGDALKQYFNFSTITIPSLIDGEGKPEEVSVMSLGPIGLGFNKATSQLSIVGQLPPQNTSTVGTLFQPYRHARGGNSSQMDSTSESKTSGFGLNRSSGNE